MMIQFAATLLLLAFGSLSAFAVENRPTNIVLIMADDLGYGGLGFYGQTKVATPNINQLAANGMRFTQAYTGCCMCAPSRCSLLTGLHTGHARVRANDPKQLLTPSDLTFASLLQKQGYATAGFGKWGLGDDGPVGEPYRHGFNNWVGLGIEQDTLIVFTSDNGPINAGGADPVFLTTAGICEVGSLVSSRVEFVYPSRRLTDVFENIAKEIIE